MPSGIYPKSEEWLRKNRERRSKSQLGHPVSNEVREKLRKLWLGTKKDETFKEKQRQLNGNFTGISKGSGYKYYDENIFTEELREKIRNRDNRHCQICGCHESKYGRKLSVHHIDYNKFNSVDNNLISLCVSCHLKTNPVENRSVIQMMLIDKVKIIIAGGGK